MWKMFCAWEIHSYRRQIFSTEGSFLLIFHIDVKLNAKTHFNSYDSSKPISTQKFVMEISADFLNRVERYNLLPMKKGLDQT